MIVYAIVDSVCDHYCDHNVGMAPTPTSPKTRRTAATIGDQLTTWRKLQGLTAQQVADRARISRTTLRKIEHGSLGVGFEAFLDVARALGLSPQLTTAFDPYETDMGRARADEMLPQRVRGRQEKRKQ
ncbi:helix-turn-helix transcriptional regulator [Paeniglutamicibacter psychrophenolicus]